MAHFEFETPVGPNTDELLEELQRAADLHAQILARQADLIDRLRRELKGVKHGPNSPS